MMPSECQVPVIQLQQGKRYTGIMEMRYRCCTKIQIQKRRYL